MLPSARSEREIPCRKSGPVSCCSPPLIARAPDRDEVSLDGAKAMEMWGGCRERGCELWAVSYELWAMSLAVCTEIEHAAGSEPTHNPQLTAQSSQPSLRCLLLVQRLLRLGEVRLEGGCDVGDERLQLLILDRRQERVRDGVDHRLMEGDLVLQVGAVEVGTGLRTEVGHDLRLLRRAVVVGGRCGRDAELLRQIASLLPHGAMRRGEGA